MCASFPSGLTSRGSEPASLPDEGAPSCYFRSECGSLAQEATGSYRNTLVASFETREEADAWWRAQAEPARRAWVRVGGELHLAVYYPNIHHRALYPLSMANGHE